MGIQVHTYTKALLHFESKRPRLSITISSIFFATKRERPDSCMRYFMKCPLFLRTLVTSNMVKDKVNTWYTSPTVSHICRIVDKLATKVTNCPPDLFEIRSVK